MTACRFGPSTRPAENWQHRLLLLNPNQHQARTAHTRVRIETRWRTTCVATEARTKAIPHKEKTEIVVDNQRPSHRNATSREIPKIGLWLMTVDFSLERWNCAGLELRFDGLCGVERCR